MHEKPIIFISYSRKDRRWLEFVQGHLHVAVSNDHFRTWDDRRIRGGGDWRGEIEEALCDCAAFILLVSVHSLTSEFILHDEVKSALEAHWNRGLPIYPIIVEGADVQAVPWLRAMNIRPTDARPLALFARPRRNEVMAGLAAEIRGIVTAAIAKATSAVGKQLLDYGRLPETAYERLVGREREFEQLDDAWEDSKTNIISLIAEGGVGKSALVNEWLVRLQEEDYRGAAAVLGWSFFSQGSQQQTTSAEPFLNWALEALGIKVDSTSATAKGERLAAFMSEKPVLLVLDGVEPLQHGPGLQAGLLKDQGLRYFLRRFAVVPPANDHGLVVVTSRVAIRDIDRWKTSAAPVVDLGRLSDDAGIALLRTNGVKKGASRDFRETVRAFGGHALSLSLLATLLVELYDGDVRQRDKVRELLHDTDVPGHAEARRVVAAYEDLWLADKPELLSIMHIVGLFDRPASATCLRALRYRPILPGLTDKVVELDDSGWKHSIARLREVRLLSPVDPNAPDALDAHPLVREWFGDRLRTTNETAWLAAHERLYEHLRDTTKEGAMPTLEDLAPLYQAISHGCRAGLHERVRVDVYVSRVCRWRSDGDVEFYAVRKLGAIGSDLAAIAWFFEEPYEKPIASLREADQSWVLGTAAYLLRAQGRFPEARSAMRAAIKLYDSLGVWREAAYNAYNLSETEVLAGDVVAATATAAIAVHYADLSGDPFTMTVTRVGHATTIHTSGMRKEAATLFVDAERRQQASQPNFPLLYSLQGYLYCDFLLESSDWATVRDRATRILAWESEEDPLLDRALVRLALGRSQHGIALDSPHLKQTAADALCRLDEAVGGLHDTAIDDQTPRGILARVAFHRTVGDWSAVIHDLDEIEEITESGPRKLYLCDMALERARLAFAQIEAFAPLNGMLDKDNPPKPKVPSAEEITKLKEEAGKQIKIADDYIQSCGYHRRDEELAELKEVLEGKRTFASLPPRV